MMSPAHTDPHLIQSPDATAMAQLLAAHSIELILEKQRSGAIPTIAVTGGTMGIAMLRSIRADASHELVNWQQVNIIWGDERWLPSDDAERNDVQAADALLDHLPLDPARVFRVAAADSTLSLDEAARIYTDAVERLDSIDLVLLGVGPDGHVASLFPNRAEVEQAGLGAIAVRDSPKPPPERISLTRDTLCSSKEVWLLVSGAAKHDVFQRAFPGFLEDTPTSAPAAQPLPVSRIVGTVRTRVYVDQGALTGSE